MPNGELLEGKFSSSTASKVPKQQEMSSEAQKMYADEVRAASEQEEKEKTTHEALPNVLATVPIEEFRYAKLDNPTRESRPWKLHPSVVEYARRKANAVDFEADSDRRSVPTVFKYCEKMREGKVSVADQPYNYCESRSVDPGTHKQPLELSEAADCFYSLWLSATFLLALRRKCMESGAHHQILESQMALGLALAELGGPNSNPAETLIETIDAAIDTWNLQGRVRPVASHCQECHDKPLGEKRCERCSNPVTYTTHASVKSSHSETVVRRLLNLSRFAGCLRQDVRKSDPAFYSFFVGLHAPQIEAFGVPRQHTGLYPRWDYARTLRRFLCPSSQNQRAPLSYIRLDLLCRTNIQFTHFDMLAPSGDSEQDASKDPRFAECLALRNHVTNYMRREMQITADACAQVFRTTAKLNQEVARVVFKWAFMIPEQRWTPFAELAKEAKTLGIPMHFVDYFPAGETKQKDQIESVVSARVAVMNQMVEKHNGEFYAKRGLKVSCSTAADGSVQASVVDSKGRHVSVDQELRKALQSSSTRKTYKASRTLK
jgi:hypothetical protein